MSLELKHKNISLELKHKKYKNWCYHLSELQKLNFPLFFDLTFFFLSFWNFLHFLTYKQKTKKVQEIQKNTILKSL